MTIIEASLFHHSPKTSLSVLTKGSVHSISESVWTISAQNVIILPPREQAALIYAGWGLNFVSFTIWRADVLPPPKPRKKSVELRSAVV